MVCDPPWSFNNKGSRAAADNHYDTVPTRFLYRIPVEDWCRENAAMFMWTTDSHIVEAIKLMEFWGFTYKQQIPWIKTSDDQPLPGPKEVRGIPGALGYYVDDLGTVWSDRKKGPGGGTTEMHPLQVDEVNGYHRVTLCIGDQKYREFVHRLSLVTFRGGPPDGMEASHLNGVRDDNRIENLEWKTHIDNESDKELHGTRLRGDDHPRSKTYRGPKLQIGLGNYFRHVSELCLFGTKGKMKVARKDIPAVIFSPRTEHSTKPEAIYQLADVAFPDVPKLEMFARAVRPGWTPWGNQVPGVY